MKTLCEGMCVRLGEMKKKHNLRCGLASCPAQDFKADISAFERMDKPRGPKAHKAPPGSLLEDAFGRGTTAMGEL